MTNRMDRKEYEAFRDNVLRERFRCVRNRDLRDYLLNNSYRYLFECIDKNTYEKFWVFDKTEDILFDINRFYEIRETEQFKSVNK